MSGQAKALKYYTYGSAAPTIQSMVEAETRRTHTAEPNPTVVKARARKLEKINSIVEKKTAPGISVLAVLGALFVSTLMVFVVLAQINFNETAGETARLNALHSELVERHRALELAFERAVDMKEVERYARDELGMSRPDVGQIIFINSTPRDTAIIFTPEEDITVQGFGTFLKSLTEYFR